MPSKLKLALASLMKFSLGDRASHFFLTPKTGEPVDHNRVTQVDQALRELGIQLIPAYSPQARGRSERGFGPGKDAYHRCCGCAASARSTPLISFYASATSVRFVILLKDRRLL